MRTYYRACKVRLYPSEKQEILFFKHINACRWVYNWGLATKQNAYKKDKTNLTIYDLCSLLTTQRKNKPWLCEVSSDSLRITLTSDLDIAYQNFFKNKYKYPKFRSKKKSTLSFPVRSSVKHTYFKSPTTIQIPKCGPVKMGKLPDWVDTSKETKIINPRITYTSNEKWIFSFIVECESQVFELNEEFMGIDLGIKELATIAIGSDYIVYKNINKTAYMRKEEKKLKHLQRALMRAYRTNGSYKETKNIKQLKKKIQKQHAHITNIRENYRHEVTSELISMLPSRIIMEDLNVSGMLKNRHLSKAISNAGFYDFIEKMRYKAERKGIEFIQVDRFYPSSKTCSCCGCIHTDLKLSDRTYICPDCGFIIDRDLNAAINLSKYTY